MNTLWRLLKSLVPLFIKRALVVLYRRLRIFVIALLKEDKKSIINRMAIEKLAANRALEVDRQRSHQVKNKRRLSSKYDGYARVVPVVGYDDVQARVSPDSILFVENSAAKDFYPQLTDALTSKGVYLLFRSKKDYLTFLEFNGFSSETIAVFGKRLSYIQTIDPNLDEIVYGEADCYANLFLRLLAKNFEFCKRYRTLSRFIQFVNVGVSDRLVGWVRNYRFVSDFMKNNELSKIFIFGGGVAENNILAFVLQEGEGYCSAIVRRGEGGGSLRIADLINRGWSPVGRSVITKYKITKSCEGSKDVILFFGNFKDPMYRGTLQPVLDKIEASVEGKLVVVPPYAGGVDSVGENYAYISPEYVLDDILGLSDFNECVDSSIDEFLSAGLSQGDFEWVFRMYVILNARKSIQRLARDCYGLMLEIDDLRAEHTIKALVSNPGRLWTSQFLTGYLSSVPSFEIQSGTLSKSRRYKAPNSKRILAVDEFSKSVYVDFLGVGSDRVTIVGAPRIDAKLADIRRYTKLESRNFVGACRGQHKVICIATQPYDVGIMSAMVALVADFVKTNQGWFLLLSMHPNENEAFENSYVEVLSKLPAGSFAISRGNIYHNINSADLVVTYFSTAGLEAFCLDKKVLTFRPSGYDSVPFDLHELGVAECFQNIDVLSGLVLGGIGVGGATSDSLERLKDGKSVDRISSLILSEIV